MTDLLKALTEANGAPGYEEEVRAVMKSEMEKTGLEIVQDRLGSLFAVKRGTSASPTVLVAGHMDEVAFMVREITPEGFLRFTPLGGWWSQVLLAQRVTVMTGKRNYTGVIGSKPPHLLTKEERDRLVPIREMYIDVGGKSEHQVQSWGIRIGDPVLPVCPFEIMPDHDTLLAKAFDNRVGCFLALELLKKLQDGEHPNTVVAGVTVQEEVGLRGAKTAPYIAEPDVAIALDVAVAKDGPGSEGERKPGLGKGPVVTFLDATMIPNIRLRNLVVETAEEQNIPYQMEIMTGGGTDAGSFHLFKQGVPSIVIGVAARYIHSHVSMISKRDLESTARLLTGLVAKLDEGVCRSLAPTRSFQ